MDNRQRRVFVKRSRSVASPPAETVVQNRQDRVRRRRPTAAPATQQAQVEGLKRYRMLSYLTNFMPTSNISNPHRDGYTHVSDLVHKCPRLLALCRYTDTPIQSGSHPVGIDVTFAIGNSIHDWVVAQAIAAEPESVYGLWKCACGQTSLETTANRAARLECGVCGHRLIKYNEVPIIDEELGITASPDLVMIDRGSYRYINEIKSIKPDGFTALSEPIPDHVAQVSMYWHLMRRQPNVLLYDRVSILYVNKGATYRSPFKEYVIDPMAMSDVDSYFDSAHKIWHVKRDRILPPRTCNARGCARARSCQEIDLCFSLENRIGTDA